MLKQTREKMDNDKRIREQEELQAKQAAEQAERERMLEAEKMERERKETRDPPQEEAPPLARFSKERDLFSNHQGSQHEAPQETSEKDDLKRGQRGHGHLDADDHHGKKEGGLTHQPDAGEAEIPPA
jgi:hypothetical protein